MHINYVIHPLSALVYDDYVDIIKNFYSKGKIIDDRGRNLIKSFELKGILVNVKSFKIPHLINRVAYKFFKDSKAKRSYENACILLDKGIGTPQPLAYFEYFSTLGIKHSYYFSEHISYDLTFRELRSNPEYPERELIIRQFVKFTFLMHEQGIYFKDHSVGNTLIVKSAKDYLFYLIDLNRMDYFDLDLEARMKNFAKLTEDPEIVHILSDEYAKLTGYPPELINVKMWQAIRRFRKKFNKKQELKQRIQGNLNKGPTS